MVPGAVATGAVDQASPTMAESFTSKGGSLDLRFDDAGTRFATPQIVQKPDIAAPDGVTTTVPGFAPFFGTSAAAPHAAGAAALLMQQAPTATPAQVLAHLQATALDVAAPGIDDLTGPGLIQLAPLIIPTGPPGPGPGPGAPGFGPIGPLEPNETSDAATTLNVIGAEGLTLNNLAIGTGPDGLPDYDWYRFAAGVGGTYSFSLGSGGNGQLEIRLFRTGGDGSLTEVAVGNANVSASLAQGEEMFVEVKGASTGVGTYGTSAYSLGITVS
jgi:hypothetical protein